jgi:hypothetical protein
VASVALIVLFASLVIYYLVHRPFSPELVSSLMRAIWEFLTTGIIVLLGGGLGQRLFPTVATKGLPRQVFQSALGLGVLSIAFLGLGALIGLNSLLVWSLTILAIYILRKEIVNWLLAWTILPSYWIKAGRLGPALAIPTAAILLSSFIMALAPPLKFDSLVYHLALPEFYVDIGGFSYNQEIMYWGFPQLPHMLSTWVLTLGATRGVLIGWAMGVLAILGLLGLVGEYLGPRRGWVAVASLLAGTSLATSFGWGYVDWPSMLFALGMIYMLIEWSRREEENSLLLAGVFAGLAFGSKYSAGLMAPLGMAFILIKTRFQFRRTIPFLLSAFALASPWLLKNFVATGNPFYPLLFAGGEMDVFRLEAYQGLPIQGNWLDRVFLPIRATFWGHETGHVGDAPGYEASIGPLLLSLGVFAGLNRAKLGSGSRQVLQVSTVIGVGGLIIWAVAGGMSGHLIRTHLYYSIFPSLAILSALGFAAMERIKMPGLRLGRVVGAMVMFTLILSATQIGLDLVNSGAGQHLLGQIEDQDYLEKNLGLYALVMHKVRNDLPTDSRVLMLWETRGYYCQPLCDSDEVVDRWLHDLDSYGDPAAVLGAWHKQGYTHMLYYRRAAEFIEEDSQHFNPLELSILKSVLAQLEVVENFNDEYVLYALSQ